MNFYTLPPLVSLEFNNMTYAKKMSFIVCFCLSFVFFFGISSIASAEGDILLHWRFGPYQEHFETDTTGHGHTAQLLRNRRNRPEPERVSESVHGLEAGSVKLTRESRIAQLEPLDFPESWTLSFWIKDQRSAEDIPEKIVLGDYVRIRQQLLGLPNPWYFSLDPHDVGMSRNWTTGEKAEEWDEIKVPAFWQDTHVGREHGYGWYKTSFYVPEQYADMEHELYFGAVDEQAWVYINGEYVGEQTTDSTGKGVGDIWDEPFSVTVKPEHLRGGSDNVLVVRSHASGGAAGMFEPAYFLNPEGWDQELDLSDLVGERATPGEWEHVAVIFEPDLATLFINGAPVDTADLASVNIGHAVVEFFQRGMGHFDGLIDDVKLFSGTMPENQVAQLYEIKYRPDAPWLAEFEESVQKVAKAGRLSLERTQYMVDIGVPDTSAVIDTFEEASDQLHKQLDAIWALGAIGDYKALAQLLELLDSEVRDIAQAAEDAVIIAIEEGDYPAVLVDRADEDSIALMETVALQTVNVRLQDASVDGLRETAGDYEAIATLVDKLELEDDTLAGAAEEGLLRLNDMDIYPDILIEKGGDDSASLLERVIKATTDNALQWVSAEAMTEIVGNYEVIAILIEKLESDRESLAETAEDGLLRFYREDIFPAALVERGDEEAIAFIGKAQNLSNVMVIQVAALQALSDLGDDKALDELTGALDKGNWRMRRLTAKVLADMGVDTDHVLATEADGWPMWRYDPSRSAEIPHDLAEELHLQWVRELPEPQRAWPHQLDDRGKLDFDVSYTPVASDYRLFVPSNSTDSVTAYDLHDGSELWRYYADGPVRLAPAVWRDRVFFTSDDGYFYCVDAESGELLWDFQAGPSTQRLLGNERVIDFWAARGGPVVKDGRVYFAAGIWPLHGIFIYALDAENGDIVWVNDTTGSDYVPLPHGGAYGYGGLSPQGYIAASRNELIVSAGRGQSPVILDRETGSVLEISPRGSKGEGDYAVHAVDGGGLGMKTNPMLEERLEGVKDLIDGEVFYKLAAYGQLVVSTKCGRIYSFGPEPADEKHYSLDSSDFAPVSYKWAGKAAAILAELGEYEGYALVLGAGSGDLFRELINRSDMHVVLVESDPDTVRSLREELTEANLYGRRAAVLEEDPATFSMQPYLFNLIVSEDVEDAGLVHEQRAESFWRRMLRRKDWVVGQEEFKAILNMLRPYSGIARFSGGNDALKALYDVALDLEVDQVEPEKTADSLYARRSGPLSGAGEWTHQYHDPANTLRSEDDLVRLPLGVLWFGGPNNHDILPRHSGGPRPQVAAGRQVYLGVENISARCVYSGRKIWKTDLPGIGHPFTNLELEEEWADGDEVYMTNIPGATYIGSPFVTLEDDIYLRYEGRILRLDASTGETVQEFSLPGRSVKEIYEEETPDWGHISVSGDFLITTSEPHIFEDQELGWTESYSGTSSRMLAVMDRNDGEVLWERRANIGFRHNAIVSHGDKLYVIDGLSEKALEHLARRGTAPEEDHTVTAVNIETGEEIWSRQSEVFGTLLLYSAEHDILIEGGSKDMRRPLSDEPDQMAAMRGHSGDIIWKGGGFELPGSLHGEMIVPGRPGPARSIKTGEGWMHSDPHTGRSRPMTYSRAYGCNTHNASTHMLLFRSGYAGFFDIEHDSGTGTLSGFRSGCTANLIAADGVLNSLDYTRTCTCSYPIQTTLAFVHMPDDENLEFWTRYDAGFPSPEGYGLNFGAPGRRVDVSGSGLVWYDRSGANFQRRHPSAIQDNGGGLNWVASSMNEFDDPHNSIYVEDLLNDEFSVRLHFSELDENVEPGDRIFDVLINGEIVIEALDIVERSGGALKGIVEEFSAKAENGEIIIELNAKEDSSLNPAISGVEVQVIER